MELKYFNARGAAEGSRLVAAAAGKYDELTDTRFDVDPSKFSEGIAVACPSFAAAREAGELKGNMNRAPVLEVDGVSIGQSPAIQRYLAKRFGLYGASDVEGALIDMVLEHIIDIKKSYQDEKKKGTDEVATWFSEALPTWMTKLEATLGSGGYAVGSSLSLADIKLWEFVKEYFDNLEGMEKAVAPCPKILASVQSVADNPGVIDYLAKRPKTPF